MAPAFEIGAEIPERQRGVDLALQRLEPIKLKSPPGASPPFPSEIRSIQAAKGLRTSMSQSGIHYAGA
jgi:hypothetical protein